MRVKTNLNSALRKTRGFTVLWAGLFGLIVLMTAMEGIVFRLLGFRYQSSSLAVATWPTDFSIDKEGHYAALSVGIMGNLRERNRRDVVLIDLLRPDPVWLGVNHLSPRHVAIAPDANWVAIAAEDGTIYSIAGPFNNSATGGGRREQLFVSSGDENLSQLVFAPDGHSIAAMGERFISVWDWPGGLLLHQHQYKGTAIAGRSIDFSPDSRTMASLDVNGHLRLCDARSGESIQVIAVNETAYYAAVVALDAHRVAVARGHLISVYGFGTEDALWSAPCDSPFIALSPSGRSLASVALEHGRNSVIVREVETGLICCRFDIGPAITKGLEFASDSLLYSSDSRGNVQAWNVDSQQKQWAVPLLDSAQIFDDGSVHSELTGKPSP